MSDPKVEHRIGVAAPPVILWELLQDPESWPSWNPIYKSVRGRLGYGEELKISCELPGQSKPLDILATIVEWVPDEQIHWTTKPAPFVSTTHYIEIDKLTETGCIFASGEIISGFMAPGYARRFGRSMYKGFELMGEAMKERAEALWAERRAQGA